MELIDDLDENGIFTGEVLPRSETHKKGLWHRAIVVAIINENNQIYDFFILWTSGIDDKTLYFQKEEVQAVKFVDLPQIQKMMEEHVIVERPEVYKVLTNYLFRF